MRIRVALPSGVVREETIDTAAHTKTLDVQSAIEQEATHRLGDAFAAILSRDGRRFELTPPRTLAALGLDDDAILTADLVPVPRVTRCEPSFGPCAGGTLVRVRGSNFLTQSGFRGSSNMHEQAASASSHSACRLSFGSGCTVTC